MDQLTSLVTANASLTPFPRRRRSSFVRFDWCADVHDNCWWTLDYRMLFFRVLRGGYVEPSSRLTFLPGQWPIGGARAVLRNELAGTSRSYLRTKSPRVSGIMVSHIPVGLAVVVVLGLHTGLQAPRWSPWPKWPGRAFSSTVSSCSADVPGWWQMVARIVPWP